MGKCCSAPRGRILETGICIVLLPFWEISSFFRAQPGVRFPKGKFAEGCVFGCFFLRGVRAGIIFVRALAVKLGLGEGLC